MFDRSVESRSLPVGRCLVLCALLFLPGCGGGRREPEPLQGAVVILVDTLRADHLSSAGYARPTTPSIDALAREAIVFENAFSNSPWTLPSVVSFLSGEYPERAFTGTLERSLIEAIRDAGFATAAFTEGGYVTQRKGMDLGFAEFVEEEGPVQLMDPGDVPDPDAIGEIERTFARGRAWLEQRQHGKFFLFLHTYEPHTPYTDRRFADAGYAGPIGETFSIETAMKVRHSELELDDADREYARSLYDGDIRRADEQIGEFLRFLEALKLDERTLVVVTSDHGEDLGSRHPAHFADHGHTYLDPLLHVPLVFFHPALEPGAVSAMVGVIDVLPSVADYLGVEIPRPIDGRSFRPLLEGDQQDERVLFLSQARGPQRVGLRTPRYKYVRTIGPDRFSPTLRPVPPRLELYDVVSDPGEETNLISEKPKLAAQLESVLETKFEGLRTPIDSSVSDEVLQDRLRSLGYVQ